MANMLDFWERVNTLSKALGISKKELATILKISYNSFTGYQTKDRVPRAEVAVKIAQAIGTSVEYLITGEEFGEDEKAVPDLATTYRCEKLLLPNGKSIDQKGEEPTMLVPIAPQKISAGWGESFISNTDSIGKIRIIERMARGIDPSSLVACKVKGDSMTGVQLFEDDIVVFARDVILDNGIYVVALNGDVLVKRLDFNRLENTVAIISENQKYETIKTSIKNENLRILGKVVGWIHNHPY